MQWYKAGTAAVTNGSAVVTGTNTNWIALAGLKPGDAFTLNGTKFYEIQTVDSETQITLVSTVTEATAAALSYATLPLSTVNPLSADIAVRVSALLNSWQVREDELINWLAGAVGGGANADGQYPMTDALGVTQQVKAPAQMQADVDLTVSTGNTLIADAIAQVRADVSAQIAIYQATAAFKVNSKSIDVSISIPTGVNAYSAGPITISDGAELTVGDSSNYSII